MGEPLERIELSTMFGRVLLAESIEEADPKDYNMAEKAILRTLALRTNAVTGIAFPGLTTLAHWVSASKSTTRATVRKLHERGALEIERRKANDGLRDTSNAYRVRCEMRPRMVTFEGRKRQALAPCIVAPADRHQKTQRGGLRQGEGAKTDPSPPAKTDPSEGAKTDPQGSKTAPESSDSDLRSLTHKKEPVMCAQHARTAPSGFGNDQTRALPRPSRVVAKPITRTTESTDRHTEDFIAEAVAEAKRVEDPWEFIDEDRPAAARAFQARFGVSHLEVLAAEKAKEQPHRKAAGGSR